MIRFLPTENNGQGDPGPCRVGVSVLMICDDDLFHCFVVASRIGNFVVDGGTFDLVERVDQGLSLVASALKPGFPSSAMALKNDFLVALFEASLIVIAC